MRCAHYVETHAGEAIREAQEKESEVKNDIGLNRVKTG